MFVLRDPLADGSGSYRLAGSEVSRLAEGSARNS